MRAHVWTSVFAMSITYVAAQVKPPTIPLKAFTALRTNTGYDAQGKVIGVTEDVQAFTDTGTQSLLSKSSNGAPEVVFISDVAKKTYIVYDFKTDLAQESPLSERHLDRLLTRYANCAQWLHGFGTCVDGGIINGYSVFKTEVTVDDNTTIRYVAPALNYFVVREENYKGGVLSSVITTRIIEGPPEASLFDTHPSAARVSVRDQLERAYVNRTGAVPEHLKVLIDRAEKRESELRNR